MTEWPRMPRGHFSRLERMNSMKILYVASEALPYASTGGLADVLGSLPIAVKRSLGEEGDVRVVIPMYPSI